MVEIIAIVRRSNAAATKAELAEIGCAGYSHLMVLGRGRERGLRHANGSAAVPFLPKVLFQLIVEDERADETIEAIIRANQTGEYGDGKIFVFKVEESYRISTDEQVTDTQRGQECTR